jgi:hypothetical protein
MEGCLKKQITSTSNLGDYFKILLPFGWTVTAFMATLAYLFAPLARNEPPRWGTAALVSLSAFAGVGASIAVYNFHRTASYKLSHSDKDAVNRRKKSLFFHLILSSIFIIASVVLAVFFAFIAPDLNVCSHETCGADVSWSMIALLVSFVWVSATIIAYRHMQNVNHEVSDIQLDAI